MKSLWSLFLFIYVLIRQGRLAGFRHNKVPPTETVSRPISCSATPASAQIINQQFPYHALKQILLLALTLSLHKQRL